jgi:hypothetical protein
MIQNPPPEVSAPTPQATKKISSEEEVARKTPMEMNLHASRPPKQEEIQFEPVARGRFDKAAHTIYRGEDLDQPAFRRRRLSIRL